MSDSPPLPDKFPKGARFFAADESLVVAMPGGVFGVSRDGKRLLGPMNKEEEARFSAEFANVSGEMVSEEEFFQRIKARAASWGT